MAVTADQVKVILDAEVDGYNAEIKQSVTVFEASMTKMERAAVQAEKRVGAAMTRTSKLTSNQLQTIQYTVNDVIASLASGANPLTILAQQGGQVTQAFGGLGGTLKALAPIAFSAGGAITAAGVALAAAVFAADRLDASNKQLIVTTTGLGVRAGLTAVELKSLAAASAEAGNVSRTAAEKMAAAYISTGRIGAEVTGRLIAITDDYARVTGTDAAKAAETLGEAFSDPIKGADLLHRQLGILTPENYRLIQSMVASGDTMGAQRVLAESLTTSIANQANNISFLERGWRDLKNTISNAAAEARDFFKIDGGKAPRIPLSAVPGGPILEGLGVGGGYLRDFLEQRRKDREREAANSPAGRQARSDALADAADRAVRDRGIAAQKLIDAATGDDRRAKLLGEIAQIEQARREGTVSAKKAAASIKKLNEDIAAIGRGAKPPKPTKADEREAQARAEGRVGIAFPREVYDGSSPVNYGPNFTNETLTTADYENLARIFISRGGLEEAARNGGVDFKPAGQALAQVDEGLKRYQDDLYDSTYDSIRGGLEAGFRNGLPGVLQYLGDEITRTLLNRLAAGLTESVLGGGGFLSSASKFIFGRANGGNVVGGRPQIVGERGRELFIPSQSGTIVPNGRLGAGGGTTIVQNVRFDNRGAFVAEKVFAQQQAYARSTAAAAAAQAYQAAKRDAPGWVSKAQKDHG